MILKKCVTHIIDRTDSFQYVHSMNLTMHCNNQFLLFTIERKRFFLYSDRITYKNNTHAAVSINMYLQHGVRTAIINTDDRLRRTVTAPPQFTVTKLIFKHVLHFYFQISTFLPFFMTLAVLLFTLPSSSVYQECQGS